LSALFPDILSFSIMVAMVGEKEDERQASVESCYWRNMKLVPFFVYFCSYSLRLKDDDTGVG
jgi:hypothetical protein